ncbi:hypothetical protein BDV96DRAFT_611331 [Lophiotrema nucula]|uniref:Survival Motor Neuron Gemin2-binding domain-containing protein n=1 Tax=Lophiotrema nucula TaxID=690887 RepID=A0A6A5ZDP9_9PLEO|nr:hypothetical protein BDV96DRAFT_611331 [Lophiotrema nucula]
MAPAVILDDKHFWDDRALINSWDEAVAEYKKYHSIQATGKRLEEVLTEDELRELREDYGDLVEGAQTRSFDGDRNNLAGLAGTDEPEVATKNQDRVKVEGTEAEEPTSSGHQELSRASVAGQPRHDMAAAAAMPQALLGTVQDENLKNLMMSWYYAGYYTGLVAGQQQGSAADGT